MIEGKDLLFSVYSDYDPMLKRVRAHAVVHLPGQHDRATFGFHGDKDGRYRTEEAMAERLFGDWPDCRVILNCDKNWKEMKRNDFNKWLRERESK